MVASLVRTLGVRHLALAEDAVQDALLRALETWKFGERPRNPAAWLMRAAHNRALDLLRRQGHQGRLEAALSRALEAAAAGVEGDPAEHAIPDDELRLMFSCCEPSLSRRAQVAVILKYLCGFSVREIAQAFLSTEAAVEKGLARSRAVLERRGALYEVRDPEQVRTRLPSVQGAVYLLFNEGYHGAHPRQAVREDLCHEALRLGALLARLPAAAGPETQALLALFCFLAARLQGRRGEGGDLLLLDEQDRARWDRELVAEGARRLGRSAQGGTLGAWHLEAAIAACHATASRFEETDWPRILALYDRLLELRPSPVVALNRAAAVGLADGPAAGLAALEPLEAEPLLATYPYLPAARADFLRRLGRAEQARAAYADALLLTDNAVEREFLLGRLREVGG